jgi:hypothetical protein
METQWRGQVVLDYAGDFREYATLDLALRLEDLESAEKFIRSMLAKDAPRFDAFRAVLITSELSLTKRLSAPGRSLGSFRYGIDHHHVSDRCRGSQPGRDLWRRVAHAESSLNLRTAGWRGARCPGRFLLLSPANSEAGLECDIRALNLELGGTP